jgi:hypothetical protein
MADVIYYNISIDSSSIYTSGKTTGAFALPTIPNLIANNTNPIIADPSQYYCSVIRFSVPCFTVPLIQFLVQTPVADVNKGIYSFTLEYNGTYSDQIFYNYTPQINDAPVPQVGTPTQDFSTYYYFMYNYSYWVNLQNIALKTAFLDLVSKVAPALDTCKIPFFNYDPTTQLISLYTDPLFFDNSPPNYVKVFFNTVSQQYFNGFPFNEFQLGSANGADGYIVVINNNDINIKPVAGIDYLFVSQEYVSLGYLSPLKNILITTNMNVNSEVFFINQPSIGTLGGNNNYLNNYINNFVELKFSTKKDKFHKSLRKNYFINEKIKLKKILRNYKIFNEKKIKLKNNILINFDINNKKKYVLVAKYQ